MSSKIRDTDALPEDLKVQITVDQTSDKELATEFFLLRERFSYVLKATQDAVWDWDLVNNIGWYSEGLTTLFGYDAASLADGVTFWYTNIHPDDMDRVIKGIHAVIDNGGKNWSDKYRFRKSDGTYAWIFDRGYAIHNADGRPIRMVGSMQDITREVEAREALRESEERFRATFDQAAVGISIADPTGKFLTVNKAYPKIFGYSEEELKGKTFSFLSHPSELEGDQKLFAELLTGKSQLVAREKQYIHKDGSIIWGRVFGTIIYDSQDKPKFVVAVLEDVTEQHNITKSLRENEERLRLVLSAGKIGTWDFHPHSGELLWDEKCRELFGMSETDPIDYQQFLALLHPDDRERTHKSNQEALNGAGNGEYQIEYRTIGLHDKKIRWVRATGRAYRDSKGNTYRYTGVVLDITEEKEREQRLREQEERFRVLANSIPQIVWTTDENGIVDYMSERWQHYTAHVPTYEKFSFRELMHSDDLSIILPIWRDCMEQGVEFKGEYRLKNIDRNEYRWYRCTTSPLKDHTGKVIKWVGSATDIHEERVTKDQLEHKVLDRTRELTELNYRLEKSNSELEQYAYVTSHDLKEPLRKVHLYNDLIRTRFADQLSPEITQFLSKISAAAERMSGLIEDLLKYSRVSNPELLIEEVNLNAVVKSVKADFEEELREKRIQVIMDHLPNVKGVSVQIHQLITNLFSNAIKFSKDDVANCIIIRPEPISPSDRARFKPVHADQAYHKIVFEDQGIGFSPKYNEQIFTIFQRLNNKHEYAGHGIGLALCRKIINNHNGAIWAHGEEGKGASFSFVLPA